MTSYVMQMPIFVLYLNLKMDQPNIQNKQHVDMRMDGYEFRHNLMQNIKILKFGGSIEKMVDFYQSGMNILTEQLILLT